MTITIITVVFNRVHTIERAICSVLEQTHPAVEYIIIDGASTDGTREKIMAYKGKVAHVISEPDKGMYDALNKGIALATGDVVGILHADDVFAHPHVLSKVAAFMQQHPHIDCVFGDVGFVRRGAPDKIIRYFSSSIFQPRLFAFGFMPAHPSFFCYRKYFVQYGNYRTDLEIAADFDLLYRFLKKHRLHYAYLREMMVKMELGGKSTRGLRSTLRINREIRKILQEHGVAASYIQLYARYLVKVWEFWRKG